MKLNILFLLCVTLSILGCSQGGSLRKTFYKQSCRRAEDIVRELTWDHVSKNPALPAKLLRMHFHDCFVRGCDGSVLLNSTAGSRAEKDAIPNLSLAGFDVIDDIKEKVEEKCPGIVSCADILALAARDSVSFPSKKPMWEVLTGRRDGIVSIENEALRNIPSPFLNFTQLKQNFANKGLTVHDLVVLSGTNIYILTSLYLPKFFDSRKRLIKIIVITGSHTIGVGHCTLILNRLYNFTGKGDQDPSLDPKYAEFLKAKCPRNVGRSVIVDMDPNSSLKFDSNYYVILQEKKGLFQSDAALLTNKIALNTVKELTEQDDFFTEFGQSMKRMGAIEVLTGTAGQIRKKCSLVNS
ncbi:hypothetical protein UlMin_034593 [Ulmus minor]